MKNYSKINWRRLQDSPKPLGVNQSFISTGLIIVSPLKHPNRGRCLIMQIRKIPFSCFKKRKRFTKSQDNEEWTFGEYTKHARRTGFSVVYSGNAPVLLFGSNSTALKVESCKKSRNPGIPFDIIFSEHQIQGAESRRRPTSVLVQSSFVVTYGGCRDVSLLVVKMTDHYVQNQPWQSFKLNPKNKFTPPVLYGHTCVALDDYSLLLFGGRSGEKPTNALYKVKIPDLLNLTENFAEWKRIPSSGEVPSPRWYHHLCRSFF